MSRADIFTVELTEAQLLHAYSQSERTLGRTLKNIKRGRCVDEDATVERELYALLGDAVYARMCTLPVAEGGAS